MLMIGGLAANPAMTGQKDIKYMSSQTVTIRMSDQKLVRSYMIAYVIIANNAQYLQSQVPDHQSVEQKHTLVQTNAWLNMQSENDLAVARDPDVLQSF